MANEIPGSEVAAVLAKRAELAKAAARGDIDAHHDILRTLPPRGAYVFDGYDAENDLCIYVQVPS